ncbi:MAG: DUF4105 domain-containing protein [Prevotella sp.]|nr:DUF4105 domain-containing protein [Prevotella sp.]
MKQKLYLIYIWVLFLLAMPTNHVQGQEGQLNANLDSIDISLLTCGPGNESYSYYGHTAIRIHDKHDQRDVVVNYGMFSFEQEHFVWRFIFGLTDYQMGMVSFADFMKEYEKENRWVQEQLLNLTPKEKEDIVMAILENSLPENVVYRYNIFYDNCTTRARDMIVKHLKGKVKYTDIDRGEPTYRQLVHQWTAYHPWTCFGNDLLLGVKADTKTTQEEQQFLPVNLYEDFTKAVVIGADRKQRPLVASEMILIPEMGITPSTGITPKACLWTLALLLVVLTLVELYLKKDYWWVDAMLFLVLGLAGVILTAMIFSQHPTVRLNLQILMLNPLALVGLVWMLSVARKNKERRRHIYFAAIIFLVLFLLGGFWQNYAEGLTILALSLLIRYILKGKVWKGLFSS